MSDLIPEGAAPRQSRPSLYFHIPFCIRRCAYCDFVSYADGKFHNSSFWRRYARALKQELSSWRQAHSDGEALRPWYSVFVGGGTPTVWPAHLLCDLLKSVEGLYPGTLAGEISCEANPGTIDVVKLRDLRLGGFNRISLGVQSLQEGELRAIGRIHDAETALGALHDIKEAGFTNYNVDVMYGLPGQTVNSLRATLQGLLRERPPHFSCYALILEEGTRLAASVEEGSLLLPDEDELLALEGELRSLLHREGYRRYEVSNWCLPGYSCRHNRNYWRNGRYLGLGCSAVSYDGRWRYRRISDPRLYCHNVEGGGSTVVSGERLSAENAAKEEIMLALRTVSGCRLDKVAHKYGLDLGNLQEFFFNLPAELRVMSSDHCRVRLTRRGEDISLEVTGRLWEQWLGPEWTLPDGEPSYGGGAG